MSPIQVLLAAAAYLIYRRRSTTLSDPPEGYELPVPGAAPKAVLRTAARTAVRTAVRTATRTIPYLPMLPAPKMPGGGPAAEVVDVPQYVPYQPGPDPAEIRRKAALLQSMMIAQQQAAMIKSMTSGYRTPTPTVDPGEVARQQRVAKAKAEQAKKLASIPHRMMKMEERFAAGLPVIETKPQVLEEKWYETQAIPRPAIDIIPQSPRGAGYRVVRLRVESVIKDKLKPFASAINMSEYESDLLVRSLSRDIESLLDAETPENQIQSEIEKRAAARIKQLLASRISKATTGLVMSADELGNYAKSQLSVVKSYAEDAVSSVASLGRSLSKQVVDIGTKYVKNRVRDEIMVGLKSDPRTGYLPEKFLRDVTEYAAEEVMPHVLARKPEGVIRLIAEARVKEKVTPAISRIETIQTLQNDPFMGKLFTPSDLTEMGDLAESLTGQIYVEYAKKKKVPSDEELKAHLLKNMMVPTLKKALIRFIPKQDLFGERLTEAEVSDAMYKAEGALKKAGAEQVQIWGSDAEGMAAGMAVTSLMQKLLPKFMDKMPPILTKDESGELVKELAYSIGRIAGGRVVDVGGISNIRSPKDLIPENQIFVPMLNSIIARITPIVKNKADENKLTVKDVTQLSDEIGRLAGLASKYAQPDPRLTDFLAVISRFKSVSESDEAEVKEDLNLVIGSFLRGGPIQIPAGAIQKLLPDKAPAKVVDLPENAPRAPLTLFDAQAKQYLNDELDRRYDRFLELSMGGYVKKGGKMVFKPSSGGTYHSEIMEALRAEEAPRIYENFKKLVAKKRARAKPGEPVLLAPGESAPGAELLRMVDPETMKKFGVGPDVMKKMDEAEIPLDEENPEESIKPLLYKGRVTSSTFDHAVTPKLKIMISLKDDLPKGAVGTMALNMIKQFAMSNLPGFIPVYSSVAHQFATPVGEQHMESEANLPSQEEGKRRLIYAIRVWNAFIRDLKSNVMPTIAFGNVQLRLRQAATKIRQEQFAKRQLLMEENAVRQAGQTPDVMPGMEGLSSMDSIAAIEFGSRRKERP